MKTKGKELKRKNKEIRRGKKKNNLKRKNIRNAK